MPAISLTQYCYVDLGGNRGRCDILYISLQKSNPVNWEPVCFRLCCSHMGRTFSRAPGDLAWMMLLLGKLVACWRVKKNSLRLQLYVLKENEPGQSLHSSVLFCWVSPFTFLSPAQSTANGPSLQFCPFSTHITLYHLVFNLQLNIPKTSLYTYFILISLIIQSH